LEDVEMTQITSGAEAWSAVVRSYGRARAFVAFTDGGGAVLGWTFAADSGSVPGYGWVLGDGRVSPATEDYRSGAEDYGRRTVNA
jgi:hypothetical protein